MARQIPGDVPLMWRVSYSLMAPPSVSGGGTKVWEHEQVNTQVDVERTEKRTHALFIFQLCSRGGSSAPVGQESHAGVEHAARVLV